MPLWPAAKLGDSIVGVDVHAAEGRWLVHELTHAGVSRSGAAAFVRGEPVARREDRVRLAQLVAWVAQEKSGRAR